MLSDIGNFNLLFRDNSIILESIKQVQKLLQFNFESFVQYSHFLQKVQEIHSHGRMESIPSKILNERKLNHRFIHRATSTSRRIFFSTKTL
jgi:hypothetical protein